jgi:hypothetical protein
MISIAANTHICLLNDLTRILSLSTRSFSLIAELSPDAIKALEKAREGWLTARSKDFPNLLLMTKLVAGGVILEGPELVYELWKVIRRWRKRVVSEHAPSWITLIGLVGWVLVAVGVGGEFWVDAKVNSDDENVQSINITLLEDASASASQAKIDADAAHTLAIGAQAKVAAVGKEANQTARRLEDANRELDKEHSKRLEMEKALGPRILPVITGPEGDLVTLKPFSGVRVIIEYVPDAEARRAAEEIRDAVRAANWTADLSDLSANPILFNGFFDGVTIQEYAPDFDPVTGQPGKYVGTDEQQLAAQRSDAASEALVDLLNVWGWRARILPAPLPSAIPLTPENAITIIIGMKPNDFNSIFLKDPP